MIGMLSFVRYLLLSETRFVSTHFFSLESVCFFFFTNVNSSNKKGRKKEKKITHFAIFHKLSFIHCHVINLNVMLCLDELK